jgi:hypothetical protein
LPFLEQDPYVQVHCAIFSSILHSISFTPRIP